MKRFVEVAKEVKVFFFVFLGGRVSDLLENANMVENQKNSLGYYGHSN